MVKLDYNRDYYGDLELTATAEVIDIKKQFKKLGSWYYCSPVPDRC